MANNRMEGILQSPAKIAAEVNVEQAHVSVPWVRMYCSECGKEYGGINQFEAKRLIDWHVRMNHEPHDDSTCQIPDCNGPHKAHA